jgi:hypothetical protein
VRRASHHVHTVMVRSTNRGMEPACASLHCQVLRRFNRPCMGKGIFRAPSVTFGRDRTPALEMNHAGGGRRPERGRIRLKRLGILVDRKEFDTGIFSKLGGELDPPFPVHSGRPFWRGVRTWSPSLAPTVCKSGPAVAVSQGAQGCSECNAPICKDCPAAWGHACTPHHPLQVALALL